MDEYILYKINNIINNINVQGVSENVRQVEEQLKNLKINETLEYATKIGNQFNNMSAQIERVGNITKTFENIILNNSLIANLESIIQSYNNSSIPKSIEKFLNQKNSLSAVFDSIDFSKVNTINKYLSNFNEQIKLDSFSFEEISDFLEEEVESSEIEENEFFINLEELYTKIESLEVGFKEEFKDLKDSLNQKNVPLNVKWFILVNIIIPIIINFLTPLIKDSISNINKTPSIHKALVDTSKLNVRSSPINGEVLEQLDKGTIINIIEIIGGWSKIEYSSKENPSLKKIGWVSNKYLDS